jgi:hypothetical protein
MSDNNDTGEIIQEFLELWQKQFSYLAKDPKTIATMLATFANEQEKYFDSLKDTKNAKPGTDTNIHNDADDELYKLRQRIANLEARVTELESGTTAGGKEASGEDTRERPKRAVA